MKQQIVVLDVEVEDRLHDPVHISWEEVLRRAVAPTDSAAAETLRVYVVDPDNEYKLLESLERAEERGVVKVRDEIDKYIAVMRGEANAEGAFIEDMVGGLVGASHIETLRKRLFG